MNKIPTIPNWTRLTEDEKKRVVGRLTLKETTIRQGFEDVSLLAAYQLWCANGWRSGVGATDDITSFLHKSDDLIMTAGLGGETGEVLEEIKKFHRDGLDFDEFRERLMLELGDMLYYMNIIATRYEIPMDQVVKANVEKLEARRAKKAKKTKMQKLAQAAKKRHRR